jgi:hypothetical protein
MIARINNVLFSEGMKSSLESEMSCFVAKRDQSSTCIPFHSLSLN